MASWLNKPPKKAPPAPEHVDPITFAYDAQRAIAKYGQEPKYMAYVREHGPKLTFDDWGRPMPLSPIEQFDLDRLVNILTDPLNVTLELVFSGLINPDEVEAVKAVHPEVHAVVVQACYSDRLHADVPIEPWAESTLSVLFEAPAATFYPSEDKKENGNPGGKTRLSPGTIPTPNDRRELGVRLER